jgi:OOP family OmpA-OmpF porin
MTKSSAASTSTPNAASKRSPFVGFLARLSLLIIAGTGGIVGGLLLAQFSPNPNPQKPLWDSLLPSPAPPVVASQSVAIVTPRVTPPANLSEAQVEQYRGELKTLQTQLNDLIGKTTTLETKLGNSRPTENIETRLQTLSQQLEIPEETPTPDISEAMGTAQISTLKTTPEPTTNTQTNSQTPTVILPSDVLFEKNTSVLKSQTQAILDNLVAELRNYPSARVRINAHTDDAGEIEENRTLSFQQAQAVQTYLSAILGNQYHWIVTGYGEGEPVVTNDTEANRQRNRRIEIMIEPKTGQ